MSKLSRAWVSKNINILGNTEAGLAGREEGVSEESALALVSSGGIKDLTQSYAEGVMVWAFDSNKETIDVHDVHGEKNLLVLGTLTEDGCLLPGKSSRTKIKLIPFV